MNNRRANLKSLSVDNILFLNSAPEAKKEALKIDYMISQF